MVERFDSRDWRGALGTGSISVEQELHMIRTADVSWKERHALFMRSQFWKEIRRQVLERDGYACVRCGATVKPHVDHKKYPGFGYETMDDLQTLCFFCHVEKTKLVDLRARSTLDAVHVPLQEDGELFKVMRQ